MNGDIVFHARKDMFTIEQERNVKGWVETFLLTSSQLLVDLVNIDHLMVLNASTVQTTLVPKITVPNVELTNVEPTKSKKLMELVANAQMVPDRTLFKETVLKLLMAKVVPVDKYSLKKWICVSNVKLSQDPIMENASQINAKKVKIYNLTEHAHGVNVVN